MNKLKHILSLVLICFSVSLFSQSNIDLALKNFKEKNYTVAKEFVNKAILEEGINKDPQVWQLRALIYKRLTKELGTEARDTALASLDKASILDEGGVYASKIKSYRNNIVVDYYNDAVVFLENRKCEESEKAYKKYKALYLEHLETEKDFTGQDVEYYLALSSKYESMSKTEQKEVERNKLMESSLKNLDKVIEINKKNYEANLRIGIIYYNRGVNLILSLTPEVEIEELKDINKRSIDIFNTALPYFLTAYDVNPNKKEIIEGLAGIYTNMNNTEEAKQFVDLLEQFENK